MAGLVLILAQHILRAALNAHGVEALGGAVVIAVGEGGAEAVVHPLAAEAAVAAGGAGGLLHAAHEVVFQVGVLLHGGHAGNLLLAAVVVAAEGYGVRFRGVGQRGRELIVEQLGARARVAQSAEVAHLVVESQAGGESPDLGGAYGGGEVKLLGVVLAADAAAGYEGVGIVGAHDVAPGAVLGAVDVEAEAAVGHEQAADALVALGVEFQLVALSALLHAAVVALAVLQVEVGNAAVGGGVEGEAGGGVGESPELGGVVVAVGGGGGLRHRRSTADLRGEESCCEGSYEFIRHTVGA